MLVSAIDPTLLIYSRDSWYYSQDNFFDRIKALALHRNNIRKYDQRVMISYDMAGLVQQGFPWKDDYKAIGAMRDLRQFILEEFIRARFVSKTREASEISLKPKSLTCWYILDTAILDAWKEMLCASVEEDSDSDIEPQIATWEMPIKFEKAQSVTVTTMAKGGSRDFFVPLVWDDSSWAFRLNAQESWPDLHRCVELYAKANVGIQIYLTSKEQPIPFEYTPKFWKSVEDICQPDMRHLLVKSIAKKVYGILDSGLRDENVGQFRRFRVSDFWRVHYQDFGNKIVLEEFGQHDMGI